MQKVNYTRKYIDELGVNKTPFKFNFGEITHVNTWSEEEGTNGKETNFGHHFFVNSKDICGVEILEVLELWHRKTL